MNVILLLFLPWVAVTSREPTILLGTPTTIHAANSAAGPSGGSFLFESGLIGSCWFFESFSWLGSLCSISPLVSALLARIKNTGVWHMCHINFVETGITASQINHADFGKFLPELRQWGHDPPALILKKSLYWCHHTNLRAAPVAWDRPVFSSTGGWISSRVVVAGCSLCGILCVSIYQPHTNCGDFQILPSSRLPSES